MFCCFCTYHQFAQVGVDSVHLNWHLLSRQVTYQRLSMVRAMCQCILHSLMHLCSRMASFMYSQYKVDLYTHGKLL